MSSNFKYTAGLHNVGSYQVSGIPFVKGGVSCTANAIKIVFPYVTRWIVVTNGDNANSLRIGFSKNGVDGSDYFELGKSQGANMTEVSPRLELKVTELWISGSGRVSVVAGLTTLPTVRIDGLSGSGVNWSGSVGVG